MNRDRNSGGLTPSAGLVRYFDAEDRNATRVNPRTIFTAEALLNISVPVLNPLAF